MKCPNNGDMHSCDCGVSGCIDAITLDTARDRDLVGKALLEVYVRLSTNPDKNDERFLALFRRFGWEVDYDSSFNPFLVDQ